MGLPAPVTRGPASPARRRRVPSGPRAPPLCLRRSNRGGVCERELCDAVFFKKELWKTRQDPKEKKNFFLTPD